MFKIRLLTSDRRTLITEFVTDCATTPDIDLHYKGNTYSYVGTYHIARDSGCDEVIYANLDTVTEYILKGFLK